MEMLRTRHRSPADDPYASRIAATPEIAPRRDPVIHADEALSGSGPLEAEQLARYRADGYLILDGFLSADEVARLKAELERLWAAHRDDEAPHIVREPESEEIRSIFCVHRTSPAIAALARSDRLLGAVRQILGEGLYIHQSRINYKPGFRGKEFYWHSDFETWHVEDGMPRMHALSVSVALTPNTPNNGPLMLVPGSHEHYVRCIGETPREHYLNSLRKQEFGVPDDDSLAWLVERGGIEAAVGDAGSVIMFDCNTMHGSNGNITPDPRSNVFLVYNGVDNALVPPFSGQRPRPAHLASREVERLD